MLGVGVFVLGAVVIGVVTQDRDTPDPAPETAVLEAPEARVKPAPETGTADSTQADTPAADLSDTQVTQADPPDPTPELAEEEPAAEPAPADADASVEDTARVDGGEAEAPEPQVADPPAEAEEPPVAAPVLEGPKFDVVRIDPFGAAVIAGTAAPGATVVLSADGTPVADAIADGNGKYVALFDLPASADPRALSAKMTTVDGNVVPSSGTVLIAPTKPVQVAEAEPEAAPEPDVEAEAPLTQDAPTELAETEAETETEDPPAEDTAQAAPASDPNPVAEVADAQDAPAQDVAETTVPDPDTEPASPAIVLADETGVTVLQPAPQPAAPVKDVVSDTAPEVVANLVIDTITYDTAGDVALSGRGEGASFARVYLNDIAVQTVRIEDDGTWRTPLPDVDAGVYRLRIDEVTSEGTVTSRVETPFQREEPEVVAEAAQQPNAVTVQEGFTLWAIARERFGDGTQFVRVYEANRDLIRDPDLIYPGQIFELPEG